MNPRVRRFLAGTALSLWATAAAAQLAPRGPASSPTPSTPTAREWQTSCEAYVQALQGIPQVDDLEVTHCLGLTLGLVEGMRLGSQLGALNFASELTVAFGLDPNQVFELFQRRTASSLLEICPPGGVGLKAYVIAVHGYLANHPEDAQRPVTEVFFEALQSAFPCSTPGAGD